MHRLLGISVLVVFSLFLSLSCTDNSAKSPSSCVSIGCELMTVRQAEEMLEER